MGGFEGDVYILYRQPKIDTTHIAYGELEQTKQWKKLPIEGAE